MALFFLLSVCIWHEQKERIVISVLHEIIFIAYKKFRCELNRLPDISKIQRFCMQNESKNGLKRDRNPFVNHIAYLIFYTESNLMYFNHDIFWIAIHFLTPLVSFYFIRLEDIQIEMGNGNERSNDLVVVWTIIASVYDFNKQKKMVVISIQLSDHKVYFFSVCTFLRQFYWQVTTAYLFITHSFISRFSLAYLFI